MAASQAFWDNIAQKYADTPVRNPGAYDETITRIRARLSGDENVLEAGCGTGTTALRLAGDVNRILATDISDKMVAIGERKAADQNIANVEFQRATLETVAAPATSFDVVMTFHLLHLLGDPEAAIEIIHGLLKPGGLYISKTACLGDGFGFMRVPIFLMRLVGRAPMVRFLKRDDVERMVSAAGFEILEADDLPAKPPCRFVVARKRPA
ncbi:MAG: class I SAM-dependent methyltransferase [Pseudomonadota bacterium]